jgi:membrane associated rhomboid family serine protease
MHWLVLLGLIVGFILVLKVPAEQIERFALNGWGTGLVTYSWLHVYIVHLIGNLLFLWPFGNAVCSKIGNGAYLLVYLLLGVLGGVIHLLFGVGGAAAFGAGVAINGVVGMYIVFFPENSISCFFFLPRPMSASIMGYWVILVWILFDVFAALHGVRGVTYVSHIFGLTAGFGLAVLMLKRKWVVMERDEKSLLQKLSREKEETEEEKKEKEKEKKDTGLVDKENKVLEKEILAGESAVSKAEKEKAEDEFIRFSCQCGKRIKVPGEYAGRSGRCPRCKRVVQVPGS